MNTTSDAPAGRRRCRPARLCTPAVVAGIGLLLTSCTSHSARSTASETRPAAQASVSATPTDEPAGEVTSAPTPSAVTSHRAGASGAAAVDTNSVQTDPPVGVEDSAVVLTFSDWSAGEHAIEASAFAQGHVDADATCALTVTRAGTRVTGTARPATPGPSSTDCGTLTASLPSSASGVWTVQVVYSVGGSRLTSNTAEVRVP